MARGEFGERNLLGEHLAVAQREVRLAGKRDCGHGVRTGDAVPVGGAEAGAAGLSAGRTVSGRIVSVSVALPWAASPVGRKSWPFCPQAASAATPQAARTSAGRRRDALTRIVWRNISEIVMTDPEYMDRAEELLARIEETCDRIDEATDADIDSQRVGGMITLTFRNGTQIIVNTQKPLHEIWMAARAGGFHYKFDGSRWMDTKGNGEFFANLTRYASEQAGMPLRFEAA